METAAGFRVPKGEVKDEAAGAGAGGGAAAAALYPYREREWGGGGSSEGEGRVVRLVFLGAAGLRPTVAVLW